jgi:hypothetical protein
MTVKGNAAMFVCEQIFLKLHLSYKGDVIATFIAMTGVSILHVLTSAMAMSSTSRLLGEKIVSKFDSPTVVIRDLGVNPVPIIDGVRSPSRIATWMKRFAAASVTPCFVGLGGCKLYSS